MKKITFLCFLMISFMFVSCDEEEDDTDEVNNPGVEESASIIGAWEPTNLFYEGSQTLEFQGQSIEMDFSAQSVSFDNFVVNIYENNTYDSSGSYTVNMSVESMGQETNEEATLENFFGTGTWSQDGTTFITTDDETGVSGDVTIEILNETTLKLVRTNYELDLSNAETPEGVPPLLGTSIIDYEMTLTRID